MKKHLISIIVMTAAVTTISAQSFSFEKFKDLLMSASIVTEKKFDEYRYRLQEGEVLKTLNSCTDLYHFITKENDSVSYELLAVKDDTFFQCSKLQGKKLLYFRRFNTYDGELIQGFGFSLESPDMDSAANFLCVAFESQCP